MHTIKRLITDERGLETVEYAVVTGLIVVGAIVAIQTVGGHVARIFGLLNTDLALVV